MMTSFALIALLTLGIIASGILPADARYKGPAKQKKPMTRRESQDSLESESRGSSDNENQPRFLGEARLPISKSLARKLSEMLTIAVAEAVAQVVEDEPSKLTACTALLRRRNYNSNVNQNYNYNTNTNANIKKPVPPEPISPPNEQEQTDDQISEEDDESSEEQVSEADEEENSESEEEPSFEEDRRDIKISKNVLAKLKPKYVARRPKSSIRTKNKNKNVNVNTNTNILSFRKEDSNKNEIVTSGETEDATTEMPKQETKVNARRRMKHN